MCERTSCLSSTPHETSTRAHTNFTSRVPLKFSLINENGVQEDNKLKPIKF